MTGSVPGERELLAEARTFGAGGYLPRPLLLIGDRDQVVRRAIRAAKAAPELRPYERFLLARAMVHGSR